jgi:hypothetical protein
MAVVTPTATFLHIPKCGGTWVMHALAALGLDPRVEPAGQHHAIVCPPGRFVFTFVRHPLSWYLSFWQYRWATAEREGGPVADRLAEYARRADEPIDDGLVDGQGRPRSFAEFVAACVDRHPGFLSAKFALYTAPADFVGRQESLRDDLVTALGLAGVTVAPDVVRGLPALNTSDPSVRREYPAGLAARLLEAEADAVRRYYPSAPVACRAAA